MSRLPKYMYPVREVMAFGVWTLSESADMREYREDETVI